MKGLSLLLSSSVRADRWLPADPEPVPAEEATLQHVLIESVHPAQEGQWEAWQWEVCV